MNSQSLISIFIFSLWIKIAVFMHKNPDIKTIQFNANDPIEDTILNKVIMIDNKEAFLFAVFDGHGGAYVSNYLKDNFERFFSFNISIEDSLINTFEIIEGNLIDQERKSTSYEMKLTGSCALVAVIFNNEIVIANLGDSKAIIIEYDNEAQHYVIKEMNSILNANNKSEETRLRKLFPNETDIVICKNEGSCYVKGILNPTYSIGDFYLKYQNLYYNHYPLKFKKRQRGTKFSREYIGHIPEIHKYKMNSKLKFLLLGSDGFWEYVTNEDILNAIQLKKDKNKLDIEIYLLNMALQKSALKHNISFIRLQSKHLLLPPRYYHDDISIIIEEY